MNNKCFVFLIFLFINLNYVFSLSYVSNLISASSFENFRSSNKPTPTSEDDDKMRRAQVFVLKRNIGKNDGSVGIINHWSILCTFEDRTFVVFEGIRDGDKLIHDYKKGFGSIPTELGKPYTMDEHLSSPVYLIRFINNFIPKFNFVKISPQKLFYIAKTNKFNNEDYILGFMDCHSWVNEALRKLSSFIY